jgi:hypothetical protein
MGKGANTTRKLIELQDLYTDTTLSPYILV